MNLVSSPMSLQSKKVDLPREYRPSVFYQSFYCLVLLLIAGVTFIITWGSQRGIGLNWDSLIFIAIVLSGLVWSFFDYFGRSVTLYPDRIVEATLLRSWTMHRDQIRTGYLMRGRGPWAIRLNENRTITLNFHADHDFINWFDGIPNEEPGLPTISDELREQASVNESRKRT